MSTPSRKLLRLVRRPAWALLVLALAVLAGGMTWETTAGQDRPRPAKKRPPRKGFQPYIEPGSADEATEYYKVIQQQLGFPDGALAAEPRVDDLLAYCGYKGLRAVDLAKLAPDVVMDFEKLSKSVSDPRAFAESFERPIAPGDILCTRYFSPKSTDVSGRVQERSYAWRKVFRLRPRADSEASRRGVGTLFLLFNFTGPDLTKSPFGEGDASVPLAYNSQAILVRGKDSKLKDPLYWLVFDSPANGGQRITFITSSWDAPERTSKSKYHVPTSCARCHGGIELDWKKTGFPQGMLNYIDTDHAFDRVQPGEEFAKVGASKWGVLFDGGKDTSSEQFRKAFNVIRELNKEVYQQNSSNDPGSFQARSVENWLKRHADNDQYLPPFDRPIPGQKVWSKTANPDRQLLPLLNNYCFRCHSQVAYHVFDKDAVLEEVDTMEDYVSRGEMPQDRKLTDPQKNELLKLLAQLKAQK